MNSHPLSIRFESELLDRLRRGATARDTTVSGLVQQLVDEGLRERDFPGIVFRDGASGRRAGLANGLDVWEIVAALRESSSRKNAAIRSVSEELTIPEAAVRTALSYYGAFPSEIDEQIATNEQAAEAALASWQAQQRLIA